MTNIILSGCNGKMGRVITRLVNEDENAKISIWTKIKRLFNKG